MRTSHSLLIAVYSLLLFAFLFSGCDKKDTYVADYQYDYMPLDTGHYVVYDVDSVVWNTINPINDTFRYQQKYLVADTFLDNQNRLTYRIELYKRYDTLGAWGIDRVWYANRLTTNFQQVEDDIRFIKLVFPPQTGTHWDGNLYTPKKSPNYDYLYEWDYNYTIVDTPNTINGQSFAHTLQVVQVDKENLISKTYGTEIYARGVGMIYKQFEILAKQDVHKTWDNPDNGFRLTMKVHSHFP